MKIYSKITNKIQHKSHAAHLRIITKLLVDAKDVVNVLDVGSGNGEIWEKLPTDLRKRLKVTHFDAMKIEVQSPDVFVKGIAPRDLVNFGSNEFEVVVAFDVIEHLPKNDGFLMVYQMERIASKFILILTPNGFVWQPPAQNNEFNAHISSWSTKDFKQLEFGTILGSIGLKNRYGPYSLPRKSNERWLLIRAIADYFAIKIPRVSFTLIAIKSTTGIREFNQNF